MKWFTGERLAPLSCHWCTTGPRATRFPNFLSLLGLRTFRGSSANDARVPWPRLESKRQKNTEKIGHAVPDILHQKPLHTSSVMNVRTSLYCTGILKYMYRQHRGIVVHCGAWYRESKPCCLPWIEVRMAELLVTDKLAPRL